jgi:hypothetical protein
VIAFSSIRPSTGWRLRPLRLPLVMRRSRMRVRMGFSGGDGGGG